MTNIWVVPGIPPGPTLSKGSWGEWRDIIATAEAAASSQRRPTVMVLFHVCPRHVLSALLLASSCSSAPAFWIWPHLAGLERVQKGCPVSGTAQHSTHIDLYISTVCIYTHICMCMCIYIQIYRYIVNAHIYMCTCDLLQSLIMAASLIYLMAECSRVASWQLMVC